MKLNEIDAEGIIIGRCANVNCKNTVRAGEFMFARMPSNVGLIMCYPCGNKLLKSLEFREIVREPDRVQTGKPGRNPTAESIECPRCDSHGSCAKHAVIPAVQFEGVGQITLFDIDMEPGTEKNVSEYTD